MKKLFALMFVLSVVVFSACSVADPVEDIQIEQPTFDDGNNEGDGGEDDDPFGKLGG